METLKVIVYLLFGGASLFAFITGVAVIQSSLSPTEVRQGGCLAVLGVVCLAVLAALTSI
jgi:hypothetical protein